MVRQGKRRRDIPRGFGTQPGGGREQRGNRSETETAIAGAAVPREPPGGQTVQADPGGADAGRFVLLVFGIPFLLLVIGGVLMSRC